VEYVLAYSTFGCILLVEKQKITKQENIMYNQDEYLSDLTKVLSALNDIDNKIGSRDFETETFDELLDAKRDIRQLKFRVLRESGK